MERTADEGAIGSGALARHGHHDGGQTDGAAHHHARRRVPAGTVKIKRKTTPLKSSPQSEKNTSHDSAGLYRRKRYNGLRVTSEQIGKTASQ